MPNASVLEQKKAIVAELTEKLQNAASGVLVDYKGITVAADTALRNELRKNNVEYAVVKMCIRDRCSMTHSPVQHGTLLLSSAVVTSQ